MLAGVTKNAMALLLAAAAVLLLSPSSTDAATLSYPKCEDGASGCCTFGSGKMKDHGYAVVRMDVDTIITCSKGSLKCFAGNPNLRASVEGRDEITCPGPSLQCVYAESDCVCVEVS